MQNFESTIGAGKIGAQLGIIKALKLDYKAKKWLKIARKATPQVNENYRS